MAEEVVALGPPHLHVVLRRGLAAPPAAGATLRAPRPSALAPLAVRMAPTPPLPAALARPRGAWALGLGPRQRRPPARRLRPALANPLRPARVAARRRGRRRRQVGALSAALGLRRGRAAPPAVALSGGLVPLPLRAAPRLPPLVGSRHLRFDPGARALAARAVGRLGRAKGAGEGLGEARLEKPRAPQHLRQLHVLAALVREPAPARRARHRRGGAPISPWQHRAARSVGPVPRAAQHGGGPQGGADRMRYSEAGLPVLGEMKLDASEGRKAATCPSFWPCRQGVGAFHAPAPAAPPASMAAGSAALTAGRAGTFCAPIRACERIRVPKYSVLLRVGRVSGGGHMRRWAGRTTDVRGRPRCYSAEGAGAAVVRLKPQP